MAGKNCPVCGNRHARRKGRTVPHPAAAPAEVASASGSSKDDAESASGDSSASSESGTDAAGTAPG
eukprot:7780988-Alexandrium_andersonii.AAC.1